MFITYLLLHSTHYPRLRGITVIHLKKTKITSLMGNSEPQLESCLYSSDDTIMVNL